MKHALWLILLLGLVVKAQGQTYAEEIGEYRAHYKQEFLEDRNSPLKAADTGYLRFYAPDERYKVKAVFHQVSDTIPFKMQTHSGKIKMYRKYGVLSFTLHHQKLELEVYQSMDLLKNEAYKDYLFIPFNDLTNYETTYAGGRYMDISLKDIKNNELVLDFNKCYNPYCAYAGGYSCPIPPDANKLKTRIEAGEQVWGKAEKE